MAAALSATLHCKAQCQSEILSESEQKSIDESEKVWRFLEIHYSHQEMAIPIATF
jgi:hypothetical protein